MMSRRGWEEKSKEKRRKMSRREKIHEKIHKRSNDKNLQGWDLQKGNNVEEGETEWITAKNREKCVCVCARACMLVCRYIPGYATYTTEESSEDQTHGPHT